MLGRYRFAGSRWRGDTLQAMTETAEPVAEIKPLLKWDELVPVNKLPMLKKKLPDAKGHPPRGS